MMESAKKSLLKLNQTLYLLFCIGSENPYFFLNRKPARHKQVEKGKKRNLEEMELVWLGDQTEVIFLDLGRNGVPLPEH